MLGVQVVESAKINRRASPYMGSCDYQQLNHDIYRSARTCLVIHYASKSNTYASTLLSGSLTILSFSLSSIFALHHGEYASSEFSFSQTQRLQLIRIRSKDGNFRYELSADDDISKLLAKVMLTESKSISVIKVSLLDIRNISRS